MNTQLEAETDVKPVPLKQTLPTFPFISVVTPTYNRKKFIPYLIECYKSQTYRKDRMEWLIYDDGSEPVGDFFKNLDIPNLRYIYNPEKQNIGYKRNFLNKEAKGELIIAMDDDDFRRGKPTNHKVFGEGIAVLAGDALLTVAFELVAGAKSWPRYSHRDLILELAVASGSRQLIAGQVADLEAEGKDIPVSQLRYIHERKTSALLCASVRFGGMSANCTPRQLSALTDFGTHVGLAFQVIDDILDVTQSSAVLGKTAGKDVDAQKATYPRLVGLEKSKKIAADLTRKAYASLEVFNGRATALEALARYLLERDR